MRREDCKYWGRTGSLDDFMGRWLMVSGMVFERREVDGGGALERRVGGDIKCMTTRVVNRGFLDDMSRIQSLRCCIETTQNSFAKL